MPRASSSAKRHQGAANRDASSRHDNGLVGPGKRISSKQRSQSLLDGGAPRQSVIENCPNAAKDNIENDQSRSGSRQQNSLSPARNGHTNGKANGYVNGYANGNGIGPKHQNGQHRDMTPSAPTNATTGELKPNTTLSRPPTGASSESIMSVDLDTPANTQAHPHVCNPEENARRIDVNAAKNANVHRDTGPLEFALTVLRSCPLYDTIAILIILMQLSPIALSLIYGLFTLLTFVPPVTTSSGLSITDMFEAAIGTPSITVLLCIDCVFLLVWIFLPGLLQNFLLDFAQVTIALTLGGGGSSRQGSLNTFMLCTIIVGLSRFGLHSNVSSFSRITTLLGGDGWGSSESSGSLGTSSFSTSKRNGTYAWIRSVLAVHIVMQGLVKCVREWYLRREKRDAQPQSQLDPEAGKTLFPGESTTEGAHGPQTESEASSSAATGGNPASTAVSVSTKKKRKQSAQVRIRQPLWAALASTKIVMVKEYELSTAARESAGSNATDIHNLGNAPFNTQPGQIWVCYVGSDEICFATSHFPDDAVEEEEPQENTRHSTSWVDSSKPFFVRVNNAIWQPTRITRMEEDGEEGKTQPGSRWTGDIYGLTPMSSYECEFVSTLTNEVIFSTSVRTAQVRTRDADQSAATAQITTHRVLSRKDPATTLKTSIANQEVKLAEEKVKLKGLRKENNRKVNQLRKEIEKLTNTVQSSGSNDEKWRQKINQHNTQQAQAEQSVRELEMQIKDMETVPEEVLDRYRQKQVEWNAEKSKFDAARSAFKSFKTNIDQGLKQLVADRDALQNKRNKIAARIAKLDDEHARITDANARGLDEAERRRQQRAAFLADVERTEKSFAETIGAVRAYNHEKSQQVHALSAALAAYYETATAGALPYDGMGYNQAAIMQDPSYQQMWGATPAPAPAQYSVPSSLAMSMWPAAASAGPLSQSILSSPPHPSNGLQHHYPAVTSSPQQFNPQAAIQQPSSAKKQRRGRSSSMLSDVSGFTQSDHGSDEDQGTNGYHHHGYSFGSGGGAGSSSGTPLRIQRPPPGLFEQFRAYHRRNDTGSGSGSGCGLGGSNSGPDSGGNSSSGSVRSRESGDSLGAGEPVSPI
ncbi:hypothetical protein MGG_16334 [Pyricularia oryzae 70-15]|uniref:Ubiquitination network signaling protein n=3 Tax=Pyricularia oryzae TaxID=318829 RepID=G4MKU9_PYRO7|nr:uncharacterized protein MGG_16334 [Pyricularia oryzae 70-15]EHA57584.1 hypothetical protein MGG_16334 [Pyricularia oryzae 70-15]ELQ37631.1 hypothetical protein OOU_Y34scaffold00589g28 [Pyricularia oryzae Y34]KAI7925414.1 hypothetical protein M0657_004196 [Pyricularia oryzae]